MGHHKGLHSVSFVLLVIGGLNWLLKVWNWDIATWGLSMTVLNVIYVLVGLAAVYEVFTHKSNCRACTNDMGNK
ncbi:MAG: hypothetical protein A3J07_04085 [Candidatus Doudnabacteria bacterium RIFCSPLOWO2_02_FULL_49_13]|uniref:DUF378 domain-containing protein n=1 Tax=Candidatus Doudnabacteria bacterium RIFCSPHIGHO2_12_FULL_48_16 TaxID=1817838 RepID=A0A1F5PJH1_9BACT|nr:MAG: hypothetical protein A3B77_02890 [Candidatus Doudnabacteria bacterium RIFCSPHIGHO2_02_FULL_49_24]OGE89232.1 MAG: hypothetical protein A2760_04470 [Candidatus Doudnabacteria bacterium RIFCSPHIGHO2_01_FULL_50_67]OGE90095.1 MAG: hypothetical protein A3E29_03225 [Candidatus Doudnabacteria bacterium RIFCSPHIGHO2_12_FULL_48_16]OGE97126.1 MAG: hypothetical protein A2990_00935 [Candidatus Doudnabacteria bacterium RIFCSPLOWO2_01_FULL_49_40]OGF03388.1 MAG: hypothetical protein A3J07_04085 [Candid